MRNETTTTTTVIMEIVHHKVPKPNRLQLSTYSTDFGGVVVAVADFVVVAAIIVVFDVDIVFNANIIVALCKRVVRWDAFRAVVHSGNERVQNI